MDDANEFEIRNVPPEPRGGHGRGTGYWSRAIRRAMEHADTGKGVFVPSNGRDTRVMQITTAKERQKNSELYAGYRIRTRRCSGDDGEGIIIYATKASNEEPST